MNQADTVTRGFNRTGNEPVFWRVEGSLLEMGALRPVGYSYGPLSWALSD